MLLSGQAGHSVADRDHARLRGHARAVRRARRHRDRDEAEPQRVVAGAGAAHRRGRADPHRRQASTRSSPTTPAWRAARSRRSPPPASTHVFIAGADADAANVNFVCQGKQSIEVLKDIQPLATTAADVAKQLLDGEPTEGLGDDCARPAREVPIAAVRVEVVTPDTVKPLLVDSGFLTAERAAGACKSRDSRGEVAMRCRARRSSLLPGRSASRARRSEVAAPASQPTAASPQTAAAARDRGSRAETPKPPAPKQTAAIEPLDARTDTVGSVEHRTRQPAVDPRSTSRRAVRAPRLRAHAAVGAGHAARAVPRRQRLLPLRASRTRASTSPTGPSCSSQRQARQLQGRVRPVRVAVLRLRVARGSRTSSASRRRASPPSTSSIRRASSVQLGVFWDRFGYIEPYDTYVFGRTHQGGVKVAYALPGGGTRPGRHRHPPGAAPAEPRADADRARGRQLPGRSGRRSARTCSRTWTRDKRQLSPIQDGTMYVAGARRALQAAGRSRGTAYLGVRATTTWTRCSTSRPRSRSCTRPAAAA